IKMTVMNLLITLAVFAFAAVTSFFWLIPMVELVLMGIAAFAAAVCKAIIFVIRIIAFFQIAAGKAKEPAIIRSLKFLK
ncbi:MAG: hypothetical protein NC254_05000, partial [bacterium]|nr:hypothetical protein [bacterium]